MNALVPALPTMTTPFEFDGMRFRIIRNGEHLNVVATDLATILGYRDAANMMRNLHEDEKGTHNLSTALNELRVGIVTEPGMYHAINARRMVKTLAPEVLDRIVRFQRWVNHEVLPSIRRTGSYSLPTAVPAPQPVDPIALLQDVDVLIPLLAQMAMRTKVAEAAVAAAQPAVDFVDALAEGDDTWPLQLAGKALHQQPNKWITWLKDRGDLYERNGGNVASAQMTDRGYFTVVWKPFNGRPRPTTRLTGKGMVFYAGKLGVKAPVGPPPSPQALLPGL